MTGGMPVAGRSSQCTVYAKTKGWIPGRNRRLGVGEGEKVVMELSGFPQRLIGADEDEQEQEESRWSGLYAANVQ